MVFSNGRRIDGYSNALRRNDGLELQSGLDIVLPQTRKICKRRRSLNSSFI